MNAFEVSILFEGKSGNPINLQIFRSERNKFNLTLLRKRMQNPNLSKEYLKLCFAHLQLEEYEEALEKCNKAVKIDIYNDEAYLLRGNAHLNLGNKTEGIEDIKKAANKGNPMAIIILKDIEQKPLLKKLNIKKNFLEYPG
ncbi:MAG: tetratricopeptide repeat protein [Trichormus sp. ATA11-4-KO1]|jgi:tetratricopeptide (TPR) repeat protein|nr:tetratricopeptide repeat protein [Trichormus sp. ATA11-4-KO1]